MHFVRVGTHTVYCLPAVPYPPYLRMHSLAMYSAFGPDLLSAPSFSLPPNVPVLVRIHLKALGRSRCLPLTLLILRPDLIADAPRNSHVRTTLVNPERTEYCCSLSSLYTLQ